MEFPDPEFNDTVTVYELDPFGRPMRQTSGVVRSLRHGWLGIEYDFDGELRQDDFNRATRSTMQRAGRKLIFKTADQVEDERCRADALEVLRRHGLQPASGSGRLPVSTETLEALAMVLIDKVSFIEREQHDRAIADLKIERVQLSAQLDDALQAGRVQASQWRSERQRAGLEVFRRLSQAISFSPIINEYHLSTEALGDLVPELAQLLDVPIGDARNAVTQGLIHNKKED